MAGTSIGMQVALDAITARAADFGLVFNDDKCSALSLRPSGKEKKIKLMTEKAFKVNDKFITQVDLNSIWKYLGVQFSFHGRSL